MVTDGFYVVIHYYQPLMESFVSKVVITTYQRAIAAKVRKQQWWSLILSKVCLKRTSSPVFFMNFSILWGRLGTSAAKKTCEWLLFPEKCLHVQSQQNRNTRKMWEICPKNNNEDTRTTSLTSSWCFYRLLWTHFTPFSLFYCFCCWLWTGNTDKETSQHR